jgi:hypothetical protein
LGLRHNALRIGFAREIGLENERRSAAGRDLRRELIESIAPARRDRDGHTVFRER